MESLITKRSVLRNLASLGDRKPAAIAMGSAAALVVLVCLVRYLQAPTFWLDESWIALSLRGRSPFAVFGPLEGGAYFPRVYLFMIAITQAVFGYNVPVLRFVPSVSFVAATLCWAYLLWKRSSGKLVSGLLGAALLVGSTFWLEQAIELKQYSFDVLISLIPFLLNDEFYEIRLNDGKHLPSLALLGLLSAISYTYPLALCSRVLGFYLSRARQFGWRVNGLSVAALVIPILAGLYAVWAMDYRFGASVVGYWQDCILRTHLPNDPLGALRVVGGFLSGWQHGFLMPVVTAVVAPLQVLGIWSASRRPRANSTAIPHDSWGSRTVGSVFVLAGLIVASILVYYPICTGRLVLFSQVHTQILAIEGALFLLRRGLRSTLHDALLYVGVAIVAFYSVHRYIKFIQEEPKENLRAIVPLMDRTVTDTVWVHPCSRTQVRSLPDPLPANHVILNTKRRLPERGQRVWIVWTHMSDGDCLERLEEVRSRAVQWQVVHQSRAGGLALAEF